ncbi:MAG: hypothetical protein ACAI25_18940, partial [Planctomycetota bacterium]
MREALDESSLAQAIRSEGGEQGVRVLVALARLAAEGGELGAKVLAPLAAAEEWLACPCSEHAARCAELASRPVPDDEIPRGRDPSAKAAAAAAHLRRSATLVAASAAQAASIASDPKCVDLVVGLARRGFASFVDARARALAHRRPTPAALAAMASIVL